MGFGFLYIFELRYCEVPRFSFGGGLCCYQFRRQSRKRLSLNSIKSDFIGYFQSDNYNFITANGEAI